MDTGGRPSRHHTWRTLSTTVLMMAALEPCNWWTPRAADCRNVSLDVRDATDETGGADGDDEQTNICVSAGCTVSAASVLANMDKSVSPCNDFYDFACGKFTRDARVDDDKTSRTTYSAVNDMLTDKVRRILEDDGGGGKPPRHSALARQLYRMCADERKLDERGAEPLLELIAAVGGWPVLCGGRWGGRGAAFRWTDTVYRFRELGLSVDYVVDLSVKVNHKRTSEHIVELDRAALALNPLYLKRGLGDRMVDSYYRYMVDVAVALGAPRDRAVIELRLSLEFEVLLARISQVSDRTLSGRTISPFEWNFQKSF